MLLTELILHNVGPYRGRQRIDLRTEQSRPVILIGGLNGCGKTTLLDSLQLALYGNRARLSNRGTQAYEDFLAATISRAVDRAQGASVTLCFTVESQGETLDYQVVRSWAPAGKRMKENLDISVNGEWSKTLSETWADHVEDLLPLELAGLFFFDGEKIEALADPERAATVIQTAIHSLLGASTLEQLRVDLSALQRRQIPSSGDAKLEQELADLVEQHARASAELVDAKSRLSSAVSDHDAARAQLAKAEQRYAAEGGDAYAMRAELDARRTVLKNQKASIQSQARAIAEGILPLSLLKDELEGVLAQADRERASSETEQLVNILGARDSWLLERLPDEQRAFVSAILSRDRETRGVAVLTDAWLGLAAAQAQELRRLPALIADQQVAAGSLLSLLAECQEELDRVEAMLAQVPSEERIRTQEQSLVLAQSNCARIEGQLSVHRDEVARAERVIEALESRLAKTEAERLSLGVADDDKRRIVEHAEKARQTLALFREKLISRNIGRIEIATLDSFRKLMRKEGLVSDLHIDPTTYAISLTTHSGDAIATTRLSAGERQLLAVALLWGLARVAGNQLPSVIDTPLGRLDSVHRQHLVERYFPHAGGQVLLLSTDEEIDETLLPILSPAVSQSYLLDHDADADSTSIVPGYWWNLEGQDVA